jgi:hypothetical protein
MLDGEEVISLFDLGFLLCGDIVFLRELGGPCLLLCRGRRWCGPSSRRHDVGYY